MRRSTWCHHRFNVNVVMLVGLVAMVFFLTNTTTIISEQPLTPRGQLIGKECEEDEDCSQSGYECCGTAEPDLSY